MPEAAAHNLQKTVDEITGYSRRTRKLVIRAAVVAIILFILSGFLYVRVHQSQIDNCTASNQTRMQSQQLWNTFITVVAGNHPSLVVSQAEAKILGDVAATYAPVNCAARYPFW